MSIFNHTAWRFAEKARFFRSLWAGRCYAAASRFAFFKGKTLMQPGDGRDNDRLRGKMFVADLNKIFEGWGFGGGEPLQRFPSPAQTQTPRHDGALYAESCR